MPKMRAVLLLFAILVMRPSEAYSDPACDGPYGVCMAGCTTNRLAERCMQRCMSQKHQCTVLNLPLRHAEQEAVAAGALSLKKRSQPKRKSPAINQATWGARAPHPGW